MCLSDDRPDFYFISPKVSNRLQDRLPNIFKKGSGVVWKPIHLTTFNFAFVETYGAYLVIRFGRTV